MTFQFQKFCETAINIDTHELIPLRSKVEGQRITRKAYVEKIEVLFHIDLTNAGHRSILTLFSPLAPIHS